MKIKVARRHGNPYWRYSVLLNGEGGHAAITGDEVKISRGASGYYDVGIYRDGHLIGTAVCGELEETEGGANPTEISDGEKRHMADMMRSMGMIGKDRHTLD